MRRRGWGLCSRLTGTRGWDFLLSWYQRQQYLQPLPLVNSFQESFPYLCVAVKDVSLLSTAALLTFFCGRVLIVTVGTCSGCVIFDAGLSLKCLVTTDYFHVLRSATHFRLSQCRRRLFLHRGTSSHLNC